MEINLNFADDGNFIRRASSNEQLKLLNSVAVSTLEEEIGEATERRERGQSVV